MTFYVYAFSTTGVALTYEIFQDIGYKVLRKDSMKLNEFKIGWFIVNVKTKIAEYHQWGFGPNVLESLRTRTGFRAAEFINKYQRNE